VILGSLILALNLIYKEEIAVLWSGHLQIALFASVIICAVLNTLGAMASDIVIGKDWVVVLSGGNPELLAREL